MTTPARVRIAPSPTGDPHVGTAYTGLFNWMLARKTGGQFLLRIEDTDRQRSTKESEEAILRSLGWLGLDWDEGPDTGGPHAPYRQSERSDIYRQHSDQLIERGSAYRCFCTPERLTELREQQKKAKGRFGYDGKCRELSDAEMQEHLAAGEPYVVRLRVDQSAETTVSDFLRDDITFKNSEVDDQVLLKSDGFPTYHLANVVDDHAMGINYVLRAEEWISSTPKHVLLYQAFGWDPPVFCHLPLLRNSDKSKISKRKNPTSLDYYRDQGYLPEAMVNFLALMGFSPTEGDGDEVLSRDELLEAFDLSRISLGGPVFDLTKLEWLNGEWIRRLDEDDLLQRLMACLPAERQDQTERVREVLPLVRERLKRLAASEFDEWTDYFFRESVDLRREAFRRIRLEPPQIAETLGAVIEYFEGSGSQIELETDEAALRGLAKSREVRVGDLFMSLRVAITGRSTSPPLLESMQILGKDVSMSRLRAARDFLSGSGEPAEL